MYTIIGNGRLAQHFCHYFDLLNISYLQWHRKSVETLASCIKPSTHVLLLISDKNIDEFILTHKNLLTERILVHCSGSLISEYAYTAHPPMTFSYELYTLSEYLEIPFVIEKEGPAFERLLPGLPNAHFAIPRADKMYYHALCVMANNFSTLLWQKFFNELQNKFNIPKEAGLPYLKHTFNNIKKNHQTALTGPLSRNDEKTLQNDLQALSGDAFHSVFQSFIDAYKRGQHENTRLLTEKTS
jgi:predicted short-subunit dehydrogenase-like oxidoreductase (DUF2520 family)